MVKIWGKDDTSEDIVNHVTSGMDLKGVDINAVCSAYNMELISYPLSVKAQRANSRKIYRASTSTPTEILIVLVDYMRKLYDENYVLLSLTAALLANGADVAKATTEEDFIKFIKGEV